MCTYYWCKTSWKIDARLIDKKTYLRENLVALPIEYI